MNGIETARQEARAAGLTKFSTGEPCRNGHLSERLVSNRRCIACLAALTRHHYEKNADAYKARAKARRIAFPDLKYPPSKVDPIRRRENERRRRKANPEKFREKVRARKAQRRGAEGAFAPEDVARIFKAQKGRCALCPTKLGPGIKELDHIQPVVRGGSNWPRNLQLLCRPCNRQKAGKDPLNHARERGLLL